MKSETTKRKHHGGERQALKNLQGNKDIVIVQADKGNATVIMDTNECEDKALAVLGKAPLARLQKDPTKKIEHEINERLRNFMAQGKLNKIEYETLRVSAGCSKPALFTDGRKSTSPTYHCGPSFPMWEQLCTIHRNSLRNF